MFMTRVSSKGQATIPKEIREYLRLKPGDRVAFIRRDGDVIVQPVRTTLLDLQGSVKPKHRPEDFEVVREETRRKVARRIARG